MYVDAQDWQTNVQKWLINRRTINNDLSDDMVRFFQEAFENTKYPNKSWFGLHKSGISLVIGGIYLAAIHLAGDDQGIWLLVEKDHPQLTDIEFLPVKSTRRSEQFLVWAHSPKFLSVKSFLSSQDIWKSYSAASGKIQSFPIAKDRDSVQQIRNKRKLSDIYTINRIAQIEKDFSDAVVNSMRISTEERRKRLSDAPIIPKRIEVKTIVFERNPDVVAEVLLRAKGFCESCDNPAPFLRRSDNTPYLEVHHKKPLALGGGDAVDNAIALCPNCHRKAHHA